jgi:hypothetical protein
MPESIEIPSRFNGPRGSGNGGYAAGVVAGLLGGEAEVNLRSPVPLNTKLEVVREDGTVRVLDGETLVADGRVATVDLGSPPPVSLSEARRAADRYKGSKDDMFSTCFVCGRSREDSFAVFAGKVEDRDLVATSWTPPPWTADPSGQVRPEFIWAALDCPTYFATYMDDGNPVSFLVRFSVRVEASVPADTEHIVTAWPVEGEGRKRLAGAALLSVEGERLAVANALLVEPVFDSAAELAPWLAMLRPNSQVASGHHRHVVDIPAAARNHAGVPKVFV